MGQPSLPGRLALGDAVVIGLGSVLGAGVFVAFGPAAWAAGPLVLVSLLIPAAVGAHNATPSARLPARHPESGGTYVCGRERLGPFCGHLAGAGGGVHVVEGEEVREPARTIPRATALSLGVTLVLYVAVTVSLTATELEAAARARPRRVEGDPRDGP